MSRRLPSSQRPRVHQPTSDNPCQGGNAGVPFVGHVIHNGQQKKCHSYCRGTSFNVDTGVSDDSFTDTSYCDFHYDHGYQTHCKKECFLSDGSNSRLPYYVYETIASNRPRNAISERSSSNIVRVHKECVLKDTRKIYPNQDTLRENTQRCALDSNPVILPRRIPVSRSSDRPQSSLSSGATSAIVDGCGGHCQTFENVCYYFLQVAFAMGVLIGVSLCIAGAVLRKSAARNLQVLVYIGALLALVSGLLLGVQCNARKLARKRKKALRNAKRALIQLDILPSRTMTLQHQQQPLIRDQMHRSVRLCDPPTQTDRPPFVEQPGVPWWRRKDIDK